MSSYFIFKFVVKSQKCISKFQTETKDLLKLTRMWSLPWKKREDTVSMSWVRWGRDNKSQTDPLTLKPLLFRSSNLWSSSFWFQEQVWTMAPNAANSSTIACLTHDQNQTSWKIYIFKIVYIKNNWKKLVF